ncbi:unnamed protein product [Schistosoma mattheei]|uniref:Uncharacterized protein n=1 Tax=Schistosoma mattheei TaxID=31246 RepID=A0A183PTU8_9TREM|nr:unnamed protein product [Schistosoma mattheei]
MDCPPVNSLNSSHSDDNVLSSVNAISEFRLPAYGAKNLMIWFAQIDALFIARDNQLRSLTSQTDGSCYLNDYSVPKLHTLGLSHNLLEVEDTTITHSNINIAIGLELKNLKALYLGYNKLISFGNYKLKNGNVQNLPNELKYTTNDQKGQTYNYNSLIGYLPNLSVLHIRSSGLINLDGITPECLPRLEYLNVR